jgi:hypothetical protein
MSAPTRAPVHGGILRALPAQDANKGVEQRRAHSGAGFSRGPCHPRGAMGRTTRRRAQRLTGARACHTAALQPAGVRRNMVRLGVNRTEALGLRVMGASVSRKGGSVRRVFEPPAGGGRSRPGPAVCPKVHFALKSARTGYSSRAASASNWPFEIRRIAHSPHSAQASLLERRRVSFSRHRPDDTEHHNRTCKVA